MKKQTTAEGLKLLKCSSWGQWPESRCDIRRGVKILPRNYILILLHSLVSQYS